MGGEARGKVTAGTGKMGQPAGGRSPEASRVAGRAGGPSPGLPGLQVGPGDCPPSFSEPGQGRGTVPLACRGCRRGRGIVPCPGIKTATPLPGRPFLQLGNAPRKPGSVRVSEKPRLHHLSRPVLAERLHQPTRWRRTGRPVFPPEGGNVPAYLVFQPLRFTQPAWSPSRWCALTAPFHPYRFLSYEL